MIDSRTFRRGPMAGVYTKPLRSRSTRTGAGATGPLVAGAGVAVMPSAGRGVGSSIKSLVKDYQKEKVSFRIPRGLRTRLEEGGLLAPRAGSPARGASR